MTMTTEIKKKTSNIFFLLNYIFHHSSTRKALQSRGLTGFNDAFLQGTLLEELTNINNITFHFFIYHAILR